MSGATLRTSTPKKLDATVPVRLNALAMVRARTRVRGTLLECASARKKQVRQWRFQVASAQPQILSPADSAIWREFYLDTFVDRASEHYQRYIASPQQFSDGIHYRGYIWDCLRSPTRITSKRFRLELENKTELFVMADDHSRDRVIGPPLWPFPPYSVACFKSKLLVEWLNSLPEDIYVFDASVSWTLVLTHEYDAKRRYCLCCGVLPAAS